MIDLSKIEWSTKPAALSSPDMLLTGKLTITCQRVLTPDVTPEIAKDEIRRVIWHWAYNEIERAVTELVVVAERNRKVFDMVDPIDKVAKPLTTMLKYKQEE